MQQTLVLALGRVFVQRRVWVCAAALVGFAAATAVAAQVRLPLPFSPVPITLQTFMVLLAGAALGSRLGAGSQALYVGVGALGAPVFAGATAGLACVSAGYLLAFPLAAWLVGWTCERGGQGGLAAGLLGATVIIYALGAAWLSIATGMSPGTALAVGVAPFLPGDALKLAAVWLLAAPAARMGRRAPEGVRTGGGR